LALAVAVSVAVITIELRPFRGPEGWEMDEQSEEDRGLEAAAREKHQAYIAALRRELAEMQTPTERASALATLYCEDNGGLGIYKDQDRDRFVVRMPVDAEVEPGGIDIGGAELIVELSRHRKAEIDAIRATLRLRRWHPDARRYVYGFGYRATADVVVVDSNAPPEVVGPLLERFPVGLTIRYGEAEWQPRRPGDPGRTRPGPR
jgi:hypothetical protein